MTPEQQQRLKIIEHYANEVLERRESISGIAGKMDQRWADAVQERLVARGHRSSEDLTPQQFFAKLEAQKREFFRGRRAKGIKAHKASLQDHHFLIASIVASIDAGNKPTVPNILRSYGEEHGRPNEWAEQVAKQKRPKRMVKTLATYKDHAVFQDLKEGGMFTQTHKSTLQNSTYSGFAALLFSGSHIVRSQRAMQQRMDAMEAELAAVKTEADRANARLDLKDQGKDWKEAARIILAAEPTISNRKLADRVGMHESTIRKYLADLTT